MKKKILLVCQNFWPENFRSTDVAINLVKAGFDVDVLTGNPNYPAGKIYRNYKWYNCKSERHLNGFVVHRVPLVPRGRSNLFLIFINYISFILFAIIFGYFKLKNNKYDKVFVFAASPIFQVFVGFFFKLLNRCKLYIWVQDLWPENLKAMNIIKSKFFLKLVLYFSNTMYNLADINIAQSKSFQKILRKRTSKEVFYLPNLSESFNFSFKKKSKKKSKLVIMYAGNIGKAQNLQTFLRAAKYFINNKKLTFKIFGDGFEYEKLKYIKKKEKISNVTLYGNISLKKLYKYYIQSDFLYLSLIQNKYLNSTIPAKMQTYMSLSKPIIASASGEVKKIINESKCGFCVQPENVSLLIKTFKMALKLNSYQKKKLSLNSRNYYMKNFNNEMITNNLKKILY